MKNSKTKVNKKIKRENPEANFLKIERLLEKGLFASKKMRMLSANKKVDIEENYDLTKKIRADIEDIFDQLEEQLEAIQKSE